MDLLTKIVQYFTCNHAEMEMEMAVTDGDGDGNSIIKALILMIHFKNNHWTFLNKLTKQTNKQTHISQDFSILCPPSFVNGSLVA